MAYLLLARQNTANRCALDPTRSGFIASRHKLVFDGTPLLFAHLEIGGLDIGLSLFVVFPWTRHRVQNNAVDSLPDLVSPSPRQLRRDILTALDLE